MRNWSPTRASTAPGLTADVLLGNTRMMRVFERGDHSLSVKTEGASKS
jgi:hypothetical protein